MALSFHFKFSAPAATSAVELEKFLKIVEKEAKRLGFDPTLVLNASFDSSEKREFARRLTTGQRIESEKLKGASCQRRNRYSAMIPSKAIAASFPSRPWFWS